MKVYIAAFDYGPYDGGRDVIGVYSTWDKAKEALGDKTGFADKVVAEVEIDGPPASWDLDYRETDQ